MSGTSTSSSRERAYQGRKIAVSRCFVTGVALVEARRLPLLIFVPHDHHDFPSRTPGYLLVSLSHLARRADAYIIIIPGVTSPIAEMLEAILLIFRELSQRSKNRPNVIMRLIASN